LLRLILVGLVVLFGARLFSSFQPRNSTWARKGLYAVLLLMVAAAVARHRSRNRGW
jgi:hypothetical protein